MQSSAQIVMHGSPDSFRQKIYLRGGSIDIARPLLLLRELLSADNGRQSLVKPTTCPAEYETCTYDQALWSQLQEGGIHPRLGNSIRRQGIGGIGLTPKPLLPRENCIRRQLHNPRAFAPLDISSNGPLHLRLREPFESLGKRKRTDHHVRARQWFFSLESKWNRVGNRRG